jgi:hypothetical protein
MFTLLRYGSASVFAAIFVWLGALNWWLLLRRAVGRAPTACWVPLLGGFAGVAALKLLPEGGSSLAWWWPLLLDAGCAPGWIAAIAWWAAGRE